jgi:uncharacterized protein YjhX (UPF0386 family)
MCQARDGLHNIHAQLHCNMLIIKKKKQKKNISNTTHKPSSIGTKKVLPSGGKL